VCTVVGQRSPSLRKKNAPCATGDGVLSEDASPPREARALPARADTSFGVPGGGCVKKTRNRHAVRKMKVGPSELPCRRRLQTALSCFGPWSKGSRSPTSGWSQRATGGTPCLDGSRQASSAWHEPDDSRGSRPDLWAARGETPRADPAVAVLPSLSSAPSRFDGVVYTDGKMPLPSPPLPSPPRTPILTLGRGTPARAGL
jgi:hypothetical protein